MDNDEFVHQRHKPTSEGGACELILACPPLRSNINVARIVRAATCSGVQRMIVAGNPKIDPKVARNGLEHIHIERRRTLAPTLKQLRSEGVPIVGLEQTTNSTSLTEFRFPKHCVLLLGHERLGISEELLALVDHVVEIPVFGLPFSFNVATATAMALYEYCRQHG
ncbi:MAG: tRNA G18 (ribose-2'-O)-methylase SpoU [Pirellulaceae bacterium]|jgi:tRNA G18 (ribose-2'-O)-methylase SpoU